MKRLIISVVGAAVIGTGLALAPPAHADYVTEGFLAEVHAEGFAGTYTGDAALVSDGIGVCSRLDASSHTVWHGGTPAVGRSDR